MKKHLILILATAFALTACKALDVMEERLNQHDKDIAALQGDVNTLKGQINQINTNINGLQTIVETLQGNVYVKDVTDVKDEAGKVIGYTITFTDSRVITIYHGEKGEPGTSPVIGVKPSGDVYYWTLNGEFMTDSEGHPIRVTGKDGAPGAAGTDGKTPQVRINEGNWEVSYDGENWTVVGPAQTTPEVGDAVFSGVKETKSGVVFTLVDGSKITIDKLVEFSLNIKDSEAIDVVEGKTTQIPYTLTGVGSGTSRVDALASGDWWAEVAVTDKESGVLKVTAGADKKAKVIVYAVDGKGRADMRSLIFNGGVLTATVPVADSPAEGGEVVVPVVTNVDYTVAIEEEAKSWLSYVITKAGEVREENLVLTVEKNLTPQTRSALVELKDMAGAVIQSFTIKQESGVWTEPTFDDAQLKSDLYYGAPYYLDSDEDGHITASDAAKVTELTLNKDYTSLKGVEAFYNLKKVTVNKTANLENVDLSQNKQLQEVTLSKSGSSALATVKLNDLHALKNVQLGGMTTVSTLELGSAPALENLYVWNTGLAALDVTKAPELVNLSAYGTKLTSLDLSKNAKLESANVGVSTLTTLTLPAEPALKVLNLDNAALTELNLSSLANLTEFSAAATQMETIDLSNSAKLQKLSIGALGGTGKSTVLKLVDVRKSVALSTVYLYSDALEEVIVPTGTKTSSWNWSSYHMDPDTGAYTYVKVTEKEVEGGDDPAVEDFAAGIKDAFVKKVILNKFDKNSDGIIDEAEAAAVKELDFSGCELVDGDLTGLEVFPIEKLLLDDNAFTTIDILAFPKLSWLSINNNKLTKLSIGKTYTDLKQNLHLEAANNQITTFEGPSYYAKVNYLNLSNNKLASFSSPYPTALEFCDLSGNALASVSLSGASALKELNVSNNKLTNAAFSGFGKLVKVDVSHNALTSYSFGSSQYSLEEVNLGYNKITSIDISAIAKKASSYSLKKVDVTGNEGFNLVIVGAGNQMPEGLEIVGAEDYVVLNAANPTGYKSNEYGYIASFNAGEKAEFGDITLNYSLATKGFKIEDGGNAYIVPQAGKKVFTFFAVATSGTPTITLSRDSERTILTKDTDSSPYGDSYKATGTNPLSPKLNESAGKDWNSFVVDGNADKVLYHFSLCGKSDNNTVADEKISFSVTGGTVVIFGINLSGYRVDEQ